ncbi:BTAD domain-containing putative transcriptional regulator [Salsipaludibacter albus]|uniref:nSTAND1 domain-containing NTPase n=1 Tax=Salsipaludibacter albus TaxID=2849650 RepID=UPI001EE4429A|nr:BTAD domain-containing putative transcriptional regulator [Salsipaludibacter albus]MBY5163476.1 hypothetical protein [Salsipaludibacter albus]
MTDLEVTLAGAVTLRRGDRRVGDRAFRARQLRLVTALLVLERAGPVSVDLLADELWPGTPPARWRVAVRGLVSQFRGLLVDVGLDRDAIVGEHGRYLVALDPVRVDLEDAVDAVAHARDCLDGGHVDRAAAAAGAARAVLSRPVLPAVESPRIERLRDRTAGQHLDALVVLGVARSRAGAHEQARSVLTEATDLDPLREDAWRMLMEAEAAGGNPGRALAAYEACRRELADELGVDPAEETQRLHADILRAVPDPVEPVEVPPGPSSVVAPVVQRPPYVGLRAFTARDADRFFGRDGEVQALVQRLVRHGIVAVVGPSGVGKSSLVRAGLLPALDRGAIPDADTWVTVVMVPGSDPLKGLAAELATVADATDVGGLADQLRADHNGLHRVADQLLADHPPSARLLVVVDQLEELFTLGDRARTTAFVALLEAATARLDRRVSVVVTLRADFYDRAAEVEGLADLLSHSQFVVPPMDGEQVEAAIAGPAQRSGASLEPGLLGRIVADVASEPGSLPLLQHLLFELWEHRVDHVLTRGAYEDLGGVAGALANRAEAVHAGLDRDERAVARRVLLRGVQPGEDGGDAKRPVAEAELVGPTDDREAVEAVVQRLVDARLLAASHDAASGRTIELAHDALIDAWPRLRAWVDEARGWLLDHRRLTVAAHDWDAHDRHEDWLLAGLPLDEAHDLLLADGRGEVDLHLSPSEHEFVTASLAARDHDLAVERGRIDHERRLERRSVRRLQALVAVVVAVALVAGALWWNAARETRRAGAAELAATANQVATQAPQLAMLLGLEAQRRLGSLGGAAQDSVDQALRRGIAANRLVSWTRDTGRVLAVDASGELFAEAVPEPAADGTWPVRVRRTSTGEVLHRLDGHTGTGPASIAAFSPDSSTLAVGPLDGEGVFLWDLGSGQLLRRLPCDAAIHDWFAFAPDGRMLAGTLGNVGGSPVAIWDVESGERLATLEPTSEEIPTDVSPHAVFHPDGQVLAHLDAMAESIRVIDTATWEDVRAPLTYTEPTELAFSPDGAWLAVVADGQLHVLDAASFESVLTIDTGLLDVSWSPLAWSEDTTRIAFGSDPVRVWTVVEDGSVVQPGRPLELHARSMDCSVFAFTPAVDLWEYSACGEGLRSWDLAPDAGVEVAWLPGTPNWQMGIDWAPDGSWLAAPVDEVDLVVWSTDTWQRQTVVPSAHDLGDWTPDLARIANLDVSSDGETVVTAGLDDVAIWDTSTWEATRVGRGGWATATTSPDGSLVAHAAFTRDLPEGDDRRVWVVDRDGTQRAVLGWGQSLWVEDLDFSPDGRLLAVAAYDTADVETAEAGVYVWDWQAERLLGVIDAGDSTVATVDWDTSGTRLLLATQRPGTRAEVWDVSGVGAGSATGERVPDDRLLLTMEGHTDWVQEAVWSPDEATVATCSGDGTARLWDTASGHERQRLVADGLTGFCRLRFSPDGTMLALSDSGAGVRVFTLESDRLTGIAEERLVRGWTLEECREYLDLETCPA